MEIFESARLQYEPYSAIWFDALFRHNGDTAVMHYIRPPMTDPAELEARLAKWTEYRHNNPGFNLWIVRDKATGQFMGNVIVRHVDFDAAKEEIEIGYAFDPPFWGQGYATEAVERLKIYAKTTLNTQQLVAFTDPDNKGSQAVLSKCGFVNTGLVIMYDKPNIQWVALI
jgi:[ribosomal protein S5]-alanine N-acetyltransferase